jgi:diguanylate cyclase (GGDEF)-like protein
MKTPKTFIKTEYLRNVSRDTRRIGRTLALLGIPIISVLLFFEFWETQNLAQLLFRVAALIPLGIFLAVTEIHPKLRPNTLIRMHLLSLVALIMMFCGLIVIRFENPLLSQIFKMSATSNSFITLTLIIYFASAGARKYLHYMLAIPTIFLIIYLGLFQTIEWNNFSLLINPVLIVIAIIIYNHWESKNKFREFINIRLVEYKKTKLETEITEQRKQAAELHSKATHDELTNLYNRRVAFSILEKHINNAKEYHTPLTVCFIDVDKLKKVNDSHGHAEGDNLLRKVAHALRENVRAADYICRLGGDEFLVIFPACGLAAAQSLVERIRQNLNTVHQIDFSYGFSEYSRETLADPEALIETADQNMYKNKMAKQKRRQAEEEFGEQQPLFPD